MYIISTNYSDDSIALLQFLKTQRPDLKEVMCVSIDTGWAAPGWQQRVQQAEAFAKQCAYQVKRLPAITTFAEQVRERGQFPSQKFAWCASFLKGLTLLAYLDEVDPSCQATIIHAKRRAQARSLADLPEHVEASEYFADRALWHPLYQLSNNERDDLVQQAGFACLGHPSRECEPCIYYQAHEIANMSAEGKQRLAELEQAVGKQMFARDLTLTAKQVSQPEKESSWEAFYSGCGSPFACGL